MHHLLTPSVRTPCSVPPSFSSPAQRAVRLPMPHRSQRHVKCQQRLHVPPSPIAHLRPHACTQRCCPGNHCFLGSSGLAGSSAFLSSDMLAFSSCSISKRRAGQGEGQSVRHPGMPNGWRKGLNQLQLLKMADPVLTRDGMTPNWGLPNAAEQCYCPPHSGDELHPSEPLLLG